MWHRAFSVLQHGFLVKKLLISHNNLNMDYTLDGKVLDVVREEKDLGVVLSNDLKASRQCIHSIL